MQRRVIARSLQSSAFYSKPLQRLSLITRTMTNTTTTTIEDNNWPSDLQIKELKQLLKLTPSSNAKTNDLLERSDLEHLIRDHYENVDRARTTLSTLDRLQTALGQDRGVLNFEHYTSSAQHKARIEKLATLAPKLYDNPQITPRKKWFQHPMYRRNSQMPPFHVHFREELQTTLQYLYSALENSIKAENNDESIVQKHVQQASQYFHGCMRALNGHVRIEEYACFPLYEQVFPNIKLKFLYEDHEELHRFDARVSKAFDDFCSRKEKTATTTMDELLKLVELVLDFDKHLLAHLGEEEELVVPLSLTEKPIHF